MGVPYRWPTKLPRRAKLSKIVSIILKLVTSRKIQGRIINFRGVVREFVGHSNHESNFCTSFVISGGTIQVSIHTPLENLNKQNRPFNL